VTSRGVLGSCQSYRNCYPFFKIPDLNAWDYWVLGNYDTCTYYNDDGRQAYGVCCTNPITPSAPPPQPPPEADIGGEQNKLDLPNRQPPLQVNNVFGQWPPPIPTHPPDHTAATHPPSHFGSFDYVTTPRPLKTTTRRTTTTWATRPPLQTTTKRPSYVTATTPISISNDVAFDGNCGAKNGFLDQERIVGGQNADPNEWPWIAVMFNGGRQFCGGSLIDNIHVLSAAHCVAQ